MQLEKNTPLKLIHFAAFDLETTGMDPVLDKIVEVGVVVFQHAQVKKTFQSLVNPGIPIPKVVLDIHGINDAMVANQPALSQVLPRLNLELADTVPLAHNVSFDLSFILEGSRHKELTFCNGPVVDTCILSRTIFPDLKSHGLQSLVASLNLECEQSHRALSDAKSCYSLFCRMVETLPLKWETLWGDFSALFPGIFTVDFEQFQLPKKFSSFEKALQQRKRLHLSYRDGKGQITERKVTPLGLLRDQRKREIIIGYCHLRQSTRTFRLDRILEITAEA